MVMWFFSVFISKNACLNVNILKSRFEKNNILSLDQPKTSEYTCLVSARVNNKRELLLLTLGICIATFTIIIIVHSFVHNYYYIIIYIS